MNLGFFWSSCVDGFVDLLFAVFLVTVQIHISLNEVGYLVISAKEMLALLRSYQDIFGCMGLYFLRSGFLISLAADVAW